MKNINNPTTQTQEVLYYLITRHTINRRQMMLDTGILNVTARISNLRNKGLDISCESVKTSNKFGRKISYGLWRLADKKKGIELYNKLQNK